MHIVLLSMFIESFLIVLIIKIAISHAGKINEYRRALLKCKECKRYIRTNQSFRIINCNNKWKNPEECLACKDFKENI